MVIISDIRSLEHPTLKVPYELLNKKFRFTQRVIDKEVSQVSYQIKELEKVVNNEIEINKNKNNESRTSVGEITNLLTGVVDKLSQLKRKSMESINDEVEAAYCCKRRLEHLKEHNEEDKITKNDFQLVNKNSLTNKNTEWHKKRLDRMLVEHFLRCGYYDTAVKLAKQAQVENLTNIDLFLVSKKVEESLANKETDACLVWCQDNKSKLRKIKSTLEFDIRQQEFVELVRLDLRLEAIKHARKYFVNLEDYQQKDLQKVMGLLAFKSNTKIEPYKSLFNEGRWYKLVQQFREENFKLYNLSSTSVFAITLQCGLSALKTPNCYKKKKEDRNPDCPVCNDLLNQLAKPLPVAHCSHSKLVCYISGQPLNENNRPLVLPNGNVYGELALKQMALENDGKIICARTKEIYYFSELKKVYVM